MEQVISLIIVILLAVVSIYVYDNLLNKTNVKTNKMTIEKYIVKRLIKRIGSDDFELNNELFDYFGFDKVQVLELINEIEMEYGIKFTDDEINYCNTPEKIINFVESRL